jgi:hypothetical protein
LLNFVALFPLLGRVALVTIFLCKAVALFHIVLCQKRLFPQLPHGATHKDTGREVPDRQQAP